MTPARPAIGAAADQLTLAATLLAEAEAERRLEQGDRIANPEGYIRSRVKPLRDQHVVLWDQILSVDPDATAQQLAEATLPQAKPASTPEPSPLDATAAAARERYATNAALAAGNACPTCDGVGQIEHDDGSWALCPQCEGRKVAS